MGVPLIVTAGPPGTIVVPSTTIAVVAPTVVVPKVDEEAGVAENAELSGLVAVGDEDTAVEEGAGVGEGAVVDSGEDVEGLDSG